MNTPEEKKVKMKLEDYPHLLELQKYISMLNINSKEYWQQRCIMLEKSLDPTYSKFERDNCYTFYKMLVNK